MTRLPQLSLCLLAMVLATSSFSLAEEPAKKSFYLIGNSLTWDTQPSRLDGDVQWHVDCGVSLPYIYTNPDQPCVKESTIWPKALQEKQYSVISVQPHYGSTLAEDVEVISAWMKLQPHAVFVLHSGWARHASRADEFASYSAPDQMTHSPAYLRALIAELHKLYPDRQIRQTMAQNLLAQIADDIAAGTAPIAKMEDLYRDEIHMTLDQGRYLMHNAMRRALGQGPSAAGFENLDPKVKQYLDSVLQLLDTSADDKAWLAEIISTNDAVDRPAMIAMLSNKDLQAKANALLPAISQALAARPGYLKLAADVEAAGGRVTWSPRGPQWLYLMTGDVGTELFDVPTAVDLYNGNNPLKGKGGRNELVTDDWLQHLTGSSTLLKLDLANCAIQGTGLSHIAGLTALRDVNLTLTPVSDEALQHLSGLTELRNIGLASTQCTGTGFAHLKGLKHVASVNLHFTPVNDAGLVAISQVPISDRLWFAHTHFTDKGAMSLAALTELKRCGIGSKEAESSGAAVAALSKLPLEDLALLDNQADNIGLAHAAKITTLRKLDVSYAPTVTDESLAAIAEMPRLEEFKIGSAQITDEGLLKLAAAKSLKKLFLSGMKTITPAGIAALQKSRPELTIDAR